MFIEPSGGFLWLIRVLSCWFTLAMTLCQFTLAVTTRQFTLALIFFWFDLAVTLSFGWLDELLSLSLSEDVVDSLDELLDTF